MKLTEKEAALEAILFTMGEAVETKRLPEAIGETPEKTRELLEKLLYMLADEGEDATFDYIRREVLHNKK